MKQYRHRYTVRGAGAFPLDMLRHDSSYPATETDSSIAQGDEDHLGRVTVRPAPRAVELAHTGTARAWLPTFDRWESFGWEVDPAVFSEVTP